MKTLKNVLLVNALSSGATGLGLIAFAAPVAILFGISETTPVMEVGIFLVAFAILVFREGRRTIHNLRMVKLIIALDIGWVHRKPVGCAVATFQFDADRLLRDRCRCTLGSRNGLPANQWNEAVDSRLTSYNVFTIQSHLDDSEL